MTSPRPPKPPSTPGGGRTGLQEIHTSGIRPVSGLAVAAVVLLAAEVVAVALLLLRRRTGYGPPADPVV